MHKLLTKNFNFPNELIYKFSWVHIYPHCGSRLFSGHQLYFCSLIPVEASLYANKSAYSMHFKAIMLAKQAHENTHSPQPLLHLFCTPDLRWFSATCPSGVEPSPTIRGTLNPISSWNPHETSYMHMQWHCHQSKWMIMRNICLLFDVYLLSSLPCSKTSCIFPLSLCWFLLLYTPLYMSYLVLSLPFALDFFFFLHSGQKLEWTGCLYTLTHITHPSYKAPLTGPYRHWKYK